MRVLIPVLDALTMALLNLCAAAILIALLTINALYQWPNPFVTVAAPLGAALFLVLAVVWILEWTRRIRAERVTGTLLASTAATSLRLRLARSVMLAPPHLNHAPTVRRRARLLGRRGDADLDSA